MPVRAANTRILIDQFDFSQQSKGLSLAITGEKLDANTLQSTEHNSLPGWPEATLDLNGYFNGVGAGLLEQELQARLGTDTPAIISVLLNTTAVNPTVYTFNAVSGSQLKLDAPIKDLLMLSGNWTSAALRGLMVYSGIVSNIGNYGMCDVVNVPPGTTGFAVLHVTNITGAISNATVIFQGALNSAFDASVTSPATFTVNNVGAQVLQMTPITAIRRYNRINVTSLGGATSLAITAIVGVIVPT